MACRGRAGLYRGGPSYGGADGRPRLAAAERVSRSFSDSSGSIVFGMEDGTVWIFGLGIATAAAVAGLLVGKLIS